MACIVKIDLEHTSMRLRRPTRNATPRDITGGCGERAPSATELAGAPRQRMLAAPPGDTLFE